MNVSILFIFFLSLSFFFSIMHNTKLHGVCEYYAYIYSSIAICAQIFNTTLQQYNITPEVWTLSGDDLYQDQLLQVSDQYITVMPQSLSHKCIYDLMFIYCTFIEHKSKNICSGCKCHCSPVLHLSGIYF